MELMNINVKIARQDMEINKRRVKTIDLYINGIKTRSFKLEELSPAIYEKEYHFKCQECDNDYYFSLQNADAEIKLEQIICPKCETVHEGKRLNKGLKVLFEGKRKDSSGHRGWERVNNEQKMECKRRKKCN